MNKKVDEKKELENKDIKKKETQFKKRKKLKEMLPQV